MKRFLLKSLLLFATIFVCDYVIGTALQQMFFANNSGAPGYVLNHIAEKQYDAYVMGASGAQRGYVPAVFEQELGLSVFNTGEAGTNIFHNYAALQLILQHSKPKLIIWDITNADYYYRHDASKTGMITPYHHNRRIRQLLYDIQPLNKLWLLSRIYPYNHKVLSIVGTYIFKPQPGVAGDKGYHALNEVVNPSTLRNPMGQFYEEQQSASKRSPEMAAKDMLIRKYFFAFIELCRVNNIRLVAFHCPKAPLNELLASTPLLSEELVLQLEQHHIPLYSIMPNTYPEMRDLNLYYDFSHLNHSGATVYSSIIAKHLQSELQDAR
ncbi:MAG: hypothetical protein CVU50_09620 [Candidatus Cloacimonetes bacterium HGW-Cloacimonetes-3]|jgi:hypothetical protein|nr:MAG: hypothetical protein CVU50_09620 [Candidatus Cloacimonetes bacterium HGW-Cloacimonetes-3]